MPDDPYAKYGGTVAGADPYAKYGGAVAADEPDDENRGFIGTLLHDAPGVVQGIGQQVKTAATMFNMFAPTKDRQEAFEQGQQQLGQIQDHMRQSGAALKKRDYRSAVGHAAEGALDVVPGLGEMTGQVGQDFDKGRYGQGIAHGLELLGPMLIEKFMPKKAKIGPVIKNVNNPTEEAALQSLRPGVRQSAGQQTGNVGVKRTEQTLTHLPGSSSKAHEFFSEQQQELAGRLQSDSAQASPVRTNEVGAGRALTGRLTDRIVKLKSHADRMYDNVRALAAKNKVQVQTGSQPGGVIDPKTGKPVMTPVYSTLESPVPLDPMRTNLKPVYDDLMNNMPETRKLNSPAFKALDGFMKSDLTHMNAMDFDQFLGAVKVLLGDEGKRNPLLRSQSQALAARIVSEGEAGLNKALLGAGPDAPKMLKLGRGAVKSYFETGEAIADFDQEPAALYNHLTKGGDLVINQLTKLSKIAPKEVKIIGRTYLEGLLDVATDSGGFERAPGIRSKWNRLGDETKQLLYGPDLTAKIDKFMLGADRITKDLNISGSGHTRAMYGQIGAYGAAVLAAAFGHPYYAAELFGTLVVVPKIVSNLMLTPGGIELMTKTANLPLRSPARAAAMVSLGALAQQKSKEVSEAQQPQQTPQ